jgi:ATP-dependent Clp protease adaptor protein ClpS
MPFPFTNTETETRVDLTLPKLWAVKILNDDFTPIEFVIAILMKVFHKSETEALDMTLSVHTNGQAVIGIYTKDVAVTKCNKAMKLAEAEGHPLRLVPEPTS